MAMYPPLKFIEQMEEYFRLPATRSMEGIINAKAMKFVEEYMKTNRSQLFHDYGTTREIGDASEVAIQTYTDTYKKFCKMLGIADGMESIHDFIDLLLYYDVRNTCRKNKLSYLIDNDLFGTLINMEPPKLAPMDCMTKLPASCFYIDYNGNGNEIMKDLDGTFIITDKDDEEMNIILVHLVHSKTLNRELLITSVLRLPSMDSDKFGTSITLQAKDLSILCEDGISRVIDEQKMWKFLFNFLIYLHAANRDVEISERTRQNHEKKIDTIKNKFREVKEFEVGFTYGRSIRQGATRIKYVGEKPESTSGGSPKSSHYRSAHWHHFWTGSGENKELIIKWVEGVFVNGGKDEAEKVQLHKVK